jgi:hypothetical protein
MEQHVGEHQHPIGKWAEKSNFFSRQQAGQNDGE